MGRSVSLVNSSLHLSVILSPSSCPYHLCFAVSQVMYYERLSPAVRGASSIANSSAHASPQESSQKVGGGREERKGGWRGGEELGCRGEEGRVEGRGGAGMQRGGREGGGEGRKELGWRGEGREVGWRVDRTDERLHHLYNSPRCCTHTAHRVCRKTAL